MKVTVDLNIDIDESKIENQVITRLTNNLFNQFASNDKLAVKNMRNEIKSKIVEMTVGKILKQIDLDTILEPTVKLIKNKAQEVLNQKLSEGFNIQIKP